MKRLKSSRCVGAFETGVIEKKEEEKDRSQCHCKGDGQSTAELSLPHHAMVEISEWNFKQGSNP